MVSRCRGPRLLRPHSEARVRARQRQTRARARSGSDPLALSHLQAAGSPEKARYEASVTVQSWVDEAAVVSAHTTCGS